MIPDRIAHECNSTFPAFHHEGERRQASIRFIVLHSTEGGSAESVARYFMEPSSGGSANIVVDDFSCYRCLADTIVPWGAPPLNTFGFHIEQCGYAAWSRGRWLLHRNTIRRAAYKASLRVRWYGIPIHVPSVEELRKEYAAAQADGRPPYGGIVTHRLIDEAFGQSDHVDPGPSYPLDLFVRYLQAFVKRSTVTPVAVKR
jgi:hypothetical protein